LFLFGKTIKTDNTSEWYQLDSVMVMSSSQPTEIKPVLAGTNSNLNSLTNSSKSRVF